MLEVDPSTENTGVSQNKTSQSKAMAQKAGLYPWFVLSMLFCMRIAMNWQRKSLSYIYGYQGQGAFQGDPRFEIQQVYPALDQSYGLLQGMAYTIPFSLCGVVLGMLKNGYNRKMLLSTVVVLGGLSQFLSGAITSFPLLCIMRAFHGACFSLTIPLLSSLLRDYFP